MKMFTKTFLNFLVCWSLLLTQSAFARGGGSDPRAISNPFALSNYATDLRSFEGVGCRSYESLSFELSGIDGLIDHYRGQACWEEVRGDLENIPQQNGQADAVAVCEALKKVKEENKCPQSFVMSPLAADLDIIAQRNNPEMRALETELKKKAYQEEVEKISKVVKMQAMLATDMNMMNFLFNSVKRADADKRAYYKSIFGLGDSFWADGDQTTLSEFSQKAFQCLDVPSGLQGFISNPESSCEPLGLSTGADSGAGILKSARDSFLNDCNEEVADCLLKGMTPDMVGRLSDVVAANMSIEIINESGQFQNLGVLDFSRIGDNVQDATQMMELFNQDIMGDDRERAVASDLIDRKRPRILGEVMTALRSASTEEERLNLARTTALNYTVDMITERFEGEGADREQSVQFFRGFIQYLAGDDGVIDLDRYDADMIHEKLQGYAQSGGGSLYPEDASVEVITEEVTKMTNLVRGAVVGQRVGDYVVRQYGQARAAQALLQPNGDVDQIRLQATSILRGSDPSRASSLATQLMSRINNADNGLADKMPTMRAAAEMLASDSFYEGDLANVAGYLDIINLYRGLQEKAMQDSSRPDSLMNAHQAKRIAGLEFMARLMEKSAQNCKSLQNESRLKHRFCSPLSDAEYGRKALENTLTGARGGEGDLQTVNLSLLYCSPILTENRLRELEGRGYSPTTRTAHVERNRICRDQASMIFCGGDCSANSQSNTMLRNTLEKVFGEQCFAADGSATVSGDDIQDHNPLDVTNLDVEKSLAAATAVGPRGERNGFFTGLKKRRPRPAFTGSGVGGPAANVRGVGNEKLINTSHDRSSSGGGDLNTLPAKIQTSANNNVSNNFMASALNISGGNEDKSLVEELRPQESSLDPATRALLERLEEMEKRQSQLQRELERSRAEGEEADDEERAGLLAELKKLKQQIPELETKLRQKSDVQNALARTTPSASSGPIQSNQPIVNRRQPSRIPASTRDNGRAAGNAGVVNNSPAALPSGGGGSFEDSSPRASVIRSNGRSGGDGSGGVSALQGSGSGGSDSVITLTQEIRDRARIVEAGVSPQDAVLQARGPVLIPLGSEGEFMMYEPELTPDGEVLTRDGEVVFKAVVRVTDSEIVAGAGRIPASLQAPIEGPEADPEYDPRRLYELNDVLNTIEFAPVLNPGN